MALRSYGTIEIIEGKGEALVLGAEAVLDPAFFAALNVLKVEGKHRLEVFDRPGTAPQGETTRARIVFCVSCFFPLLLPLLFDCRELFSVSEPSRIPLLVIDLRWASLAPPGAIERK